MVRHPLIHITKTLIAFLLIPILTITSCTDIQASPTTASTPSPIVLSTLANSEAPVLSQVAFTVQLPSALKKEQKLSLELLDEVTGIALNPQRFEMQFVNATHYNVIVPIVTGSVVKYRYIREDKATAIEYNTQGKQVRYRLFHVTNPALVQDVISAWIDQPYKGPSGRIQGRVMNASNQVPIPAALVAAGGLQTLTSSDGSFLLEGLPPGTHNLVIYSLDGSFIPFQQGATVATESATPADIVVTPAKFIDITFKVRPPDGSPKGIPIRLIGNIFQLGNTFSDLRGGMNAIASRAPLLTPGEDGNYSITLSLPAGLDLRYKYTLGDGFWNAERSEKGAYHVRQLIVPEKETTLNDQIDRWTTDGKGTITFAVTVPSTTSPNDVVSIQFNPYGWTEPVPMWPLGNNRWLYVLFNPMDLIGDSSYRYCRNDQCGIADDAATEGPDAAGKPFTPKADAQSFSDTVTEWAWSDPNPSPITVTSAAITARPSTYFTGIELLPDYHPSWQPYYNWAFQDISKMRSKWVMIAPTWHYTNNNPPVIGPVSGVDASWYDLGKTMTTARQSNLKISLHPVAAYYKPSDVWWAEGKRDEGWWQSWFDRFETFTTNYADLAAQTGAETLIFGESSLQPSFPGGKLFDGSSSNVPGVAADRWRDIIKHIRSRYKGQLGWYLNYPADFANLPPFLGDVDQIYVVLSGKLSDSETPTQDELRQSFAKILSSQILPLKDRLKKPVIVGISYPSAKGAAAGCVLSSGACLPAIVLTQGGLELPSVDPDLKAQADIYNAFFEAVNADPNLDGAFASGYYPPVSLADKSTSIHGKQSSDVTWFWFDRFNGPAQ